MQFYQTTRRRPQTLSALQDYIRADELQEMSGSIVGLQPTQTAHVQLRWGSRVFRTLRSFSRGRRMLLPTSTHTRMWRGRLHTTHYLRRPRSHTRLHRSSSLAYLRLLRFLIRRNDFQSQNLTRPKRCCHFESNGCQPLLRHFLGRMPLQPTRLELRTQTL